VFINCVFMQLCIRVAMYLCTYLFMQLYICSYLLKQLFIYESYKSLASSHHIYTLFTLHSLDIPFTPHSFLPSHYLHLLSTPHSQCPTLSSHYIRNALTLPSHYIHSISTLTPYQLSLLHRVNILTQYNTFIV